MLILTLIGKYLISLCLCQDRLALQRGGPQNLITLPASRSWARGSLPPLAQVACVTVGPATQLPADGTREARGNSALAMRCLKEKETHVRTHVVLGVWGGDEDREAPQQ